MVALTASLITSIPYDAPCPHFSGNCLRLVWRKPDLLHCAGHVTTSDSHCCVSCCHHRVLQERILVNAARRNALVYCRPI